MSAKVINFPALIDLPPARRQASDEPCSVLFLPVTTVEQRVADDDFSKLSPKAIRNLQFWDSVGLFDNPARPSCYLCDPETGEVWCGSCGAEPPTPHMSDCQALAAKLPK